MYAAIAFSAEEPNLIILRVDILPNIQVKDGFPLRGVIVFLYLTLHIYLLFSPRDSNGKANTATLLRHSTILKRAPNGST